MSLNLDAAIRLTANVSGVSGINQTKTALQQLAGGSELTNRQLLGLELTTKKFAAANSNTVSGIRNSISALRGLRDQHEINSKSFQRLTRDIEAYEKRLKAATMQTSAAKVAAPAFEGLGSGIAGSLATGGGLQSGIGAAGGALAAAGGPAGIAAAAALTAGAATIGAGIGNARDIAAQGRAISTLTSDSEALTKTIRDLVTEQGFLTSEAEAGAAAYEILSSGFSKTADVTAILAASTRGAVGGFSDIKTVADATTSILNGYGKGAEYAAQVIDMMIQTQNDGKIVVSQYAQSIGRLVPTAAAAGIGLDELNAGISALTAQGVPAESTFSGLNQTIKSILKPTDEARNLAEALGLEFNASALAAKGLGGFLQDVQEKTKGNSNALSILFSDIDGFKAVVALTNDQLGRYNGFLENQRIKTGQSADAAKKAIDPFAQFNNAWKTLSATIGREFLPGITEAIKATTGLIRLLTSDQAKVAFDVASVAFMPQSIVPVVANRLKGGQQQPAAKPTAQARTQIKPPPKAEDPGVTAQVNQVLNGGDKANASTEADKAARDAEQLARRAAEVAAQTAKATADLERSLMEANAKVRQNLDAATNRLAMEAIRKRYEYEEQLINKQQDLWVNSVVGAERTARGQIAGFLRDIHANESGVRDAAEQQLQREQQLKAARENLRVAEQSAAMERASGRAYAASQAAAGQMGGGGAVGKGAAGRIIEYLTGDRSHAGYRADHGGSNYHDHLAFGSPAEMQAAKKALEAAGIQVGSTTGGRHAPNSYHYSGQALDVPAAQVPVGQEQALSRRVRAVLAAAGFGAGSGSSSTTTPSPAQPTQPYLDTTGPGLAAARGEVQAAQLDLKAAQEASKGAVEQAGKLRELINSGFLQNYANDFREQTDAIIRSNEVTAARNALELEGARPELIDAAVRKAEAQQLYGSKVQGVTDALALLDKTGKGSTQEAETLRQTLQTMSTDYANLTLQIDAAARAQMNFNDAMRFRQDNRIGMGIREGAQQYVESIGTMREATAQLATQGIQGVEEALVQLATTGTANFKQFAAQMLADTARVIIQQLVLRSILQAIGGIGGGGGGGGFGGGYFDPITGKGAAGPNFGLAMGGVIGRDGLQPFAMGGIVTRPTLFRYANGGVPGMGLMGEAGPEAIIPLRRGRDGKLGVTATGGGGGGNNNITINVDASGSSIQGDQGSGRELAQVVSSAVQAEMVRQSRPGGILNRRN